MGTSEDSSGTHDSSNAGLFHQATDVQENTEACMKANGKHSTMLIQQQQEIEDQEDLNRGKDASIEKLEKRFREVEIMNVDQTKAGEQDVGGSSMYSTAGEGRKEQNKPIMTFLDEEDKQDSLKYLETIAELKAGVRERPEAASSIETQDPESKARARAARSMMSLEEKEMIDSGLFEAIKRLDTDQIEVILRFGADVNAVDPDSGQTPLVIACELNELEIVQALIEHGANVDAAIDDEGCTALILACLMGNLEIVETLVKYGANVDAELSDNKATALVGAAMRGQPDIVEVLAKHGANVNAATTDGGATALMTAARVGHLETVETLIMHGANVDAVASDDSTTAIVVAMDEGHLEIVEALIKHGARVNVAALSQDNEAIAHLLRDSGDAQKKI